QRVEGALKSGGVARFKDAAIDEKTAIAVFGEAGEAVDLRDRQPRGLERLDERVGEPLAELVKRHEPIAWYCRMTAAIAQRHAAEADAPRPDRSEQLQRTAQDFRG